MEVRMNGTNLVSGETPSRELVRQLRRGAQGDGEYMPENIIWRSYMELRRRDIGEAESLFIRALRSLHSRRSLGGIELSTVDEDPNEHRLTDDPFLADLWKAYKKCIRTHRTGPASQLLRDIELQVAQAEC